MTMKDHMHNVFLEFLGNIAMCHFLHSCRTCTVSKWGLGDSQGSITQWKVQELKKKNFHGHNK